MNPIRTEVLSALRKGNNLTVAQIAGLVLAERQEGSTLRGKLRWGQRTAGTLEDIGKLGDELKLQGRIEEVLSDLHSQNLVEYRETPRGYAYTRIYPT